MIRTAYAPLRDDELLTFEASRTARTDMEIELAQRLHVALGLIEDLGGELNEPSSAMPCDLPLFDVSES